MHVGQMTACQQFFPAQYAGLEHTKRVNPERTVRYSSIFSQKVRHQGNRSLIDIRELAGKDADSAVWVNGQVAHPFWPWLSSPCAAKSWCTCSELNKAIEALTASKARIEYLQFPEWN